MVLVIFVYKYLENTSELFQKEFKINPGKLALGNHHGLYFEHQVSSYKLKVNIDIY